MLTTTEKILFILLAVGCLYTAAQSFTVVYRAIKRGKPDTRFDHLLERIQNGRYGSSDAAIGF